MPSKDKRTKAELLAELAVKDGKLAEYERIIIGKDEQLKRALAEKDKTMIQNRIDHHKAVERYGAEISRLGEMLHLQSIVSIKSVSFLEGRVDGLGAALKIVLGKDDSKGGWTCPEVEKLKEVLEHAIGANDAAGGKTDKG